MPWIPSVLAVLAAFALVAAALFLARIPRERRLREACQSLRVRSRGEGFRPEMVAGLPDPARRYLLHSIELGTQLARSVSLKMKGSIRLRPGRRLAPMRGEEILAVPEGFVWRARIGRMLWWFRGSDEYTGGAGRMTWRLWGLAPLVRAEGENVSRSAAGRLALEAIWLPSALVPRRGVRWEPADGSSARVSFEVNGEPQTLTLTVAADGRLRKVEALRWGNRGKGGAYSHAPFCAECLEEQTFEGYTVPTRIRAGWRSETGDFDDFFQPIVEDAEFS